MSEKEKTYYRKLMDSLSLENQWRTERENRIIWEKEYRKLVEEKKELEKQNRKLKEELRKIREVYEDWAFESYDDTTETFMVRMEKLLGIGLETDKKGLEDEKQ